MNADSLVQKVAPHLQPTNNFQYVLLLIFCGVIIMTLGGKYLQLRYRETKTSNGKRSSLDDSMLKISQTMGRIAQAQENQIKISDSHGKQITDLYEKNSENRVQIAEVKSFIRGQNSLGEKRE